MLRIVTDGAADMPQGWEQEYAIHVVPINIHIGDKTYLSGVDLNNEDFYRLVDESGAIPKTSQPTPFQFKEFYRKVARAGDTILSIHVTSRLSGTFDSALLAARDLAGKYNLIPFDSFSGSAAIGMMCREARLLERAGATLEKIIARLEQIRREVRIALTLDTLTYARMSGRIGALQAALASLMNVKPIVILHEGLLEMSERVRTRRRALERVIELIRESFGGQELNMAVVQARDPEAGRVLQEEAQKRFNIREMIMTDLSISVAANLGPGTVGLVAYPVGEG